MMGEPAFSPPDAGLPFAILLVDDEPMARKWFERVYGEEFVVWTAAGVDEALQRLAIEAGQVAVLLTDFRMPDRDGLELLALVRQRHEHVARLLVSAFADKSLVLAAVNEGQVEHILEKPFDEQETRQVLRRALAGSVRRVQDRRLAASRATAMRDTLGFLAHEVTTPLATLRGYLGALSERHLEGAGDVTARFAQERPGHVLGMIEAARKRADYAQSLVTGFLHHARDVSLGQGDMPVQAADWVRSVLRHYPFEPGEADCVVLQVQTDFALPGRRDLLQLVIGSLIKNALLAVRAGSERAPRIGLTLSWRPPPAGGPPAPCLAVSDNGCGVDPRMLPRLGLEPVTSTLGVGGSGMGLLFCRRVMLSLAGSLSIESEPGQGTTVCLYFPAPDQRPARASHEQEPS